MILEGWSLFGVCLFYGGLRLRLSFGAESSKVPRNRDKSQDSLDSHPGFGFSASFCSGPVMAWPAGQPASPPSSKRVLHSISEVYNLPKAQSILGYPIDFEAVVTYSDAEWRTLFVQDKLGRTFINFEGHKNNYPLGTRIRVTGITDFTGYAASIANPKIQFLGVGPEVKPIAKTVEELDTGEFDSVLVVTEGVLHPCIEPERPRLFPPCAGKDAISIAVSRTL